VNNAAHESAPGALARSAFAALQPGENPTPDALWAAVGRTRGLVEALLPGIGFITVYTLTGNLLWSVGAPALLSAIFILARAVTRSPVIGAVAGFIGVLASAGVALWSGRAEDNFLLGFVVNAIWVVALVVSIALGRPLIGVLYGALTGNSGWRDDPTSKRVGTVATWLWVGVFSSRLALQVPLYLAGAVQALAATKLAMGVPLYAAALWMTWLLMRAVYRRDQAAAR